MPKRSLALLLLFSFGLSACTSSPPPVILPAAPLLPTMTAAPTATLVPTATPTATPLGCLTAPGKVVEGQIDTTKPPQQFLVYLPPCYDYYTESRYPVLYLLHGQTSTDDQWVRMGATTIADNLIHSDQIVPLIMVFPDDRYWNLPAGPGFGDRLLSLIVPYIDATFRTQADAHHRALGGLSRGGGWAIHMLLTQYTTFGVIGLHSPVIFDDDGAFLDKLFASVPSNAWPRLWIDAGDRDGQLGDIRMFEGMLTNYEVPHEWRLYSGDHSEGYWESHIAEYLQWYSQQFVAPAEPTAIAPTLVVETPFPTSTAPTLTPSITPSVTASVTPSITPSVAPSVTPTP